MADWWTLAATLLSLLGLAVVVAVVFLHDPHRSASARRVRLYHRN
jgi:hypothetical protein